MKRPAHSSKVQKTRRVKINAIEQNRWAAGYTMVQNEQTKLNLMSRLSEIEEKLADQQNQQSIHNQFLGVSQ